MSRLARILRIKHLGLLNALFWTILGGVSLSQYYAQAIRFGRTFNEISIIRHPIATYLSFWILSFLVFDLYLITRRFDWRHIWFWILHISTAIVFGLLHKTLSYTVGLLLERLFLTQETASWRELILLWQQTLPDVLHGVSVYFLLLFILIALDDRRRFRDEHYRSLQLQNQLSYAQLQTLRIQLQPHFLFNALNTIAMMVRRKKSAEAISMVTNLSEMLRGNLQHKQKQWVTLEEELVLVGQYLAIEKARYPDRLRVTQRVASDTLPLPVPNLILQPIVENAFKHGIAQSLSSARLEINAYREKRWLVIEVFNTGRSLPTGWNLHDHQGIGLGNTVNRLMQLYPGDFRFQISEPEGGVQVRMVLPVKEQIEKGNKYSLT